MLEKILENPLDCKKIQPLKIKEISLEYSFGKTGVETEISILWPPMRRADSLERTLMLGKNEGGRRRG